MTQLLPMQTLPVQDFNTMMVQRYGYSPINVFMKSNGELRRSGYVAYYAAHPLARAILRRTKKQAIADYQFPLDN